MANITKIQLFFRSRLAAIVGAFLVAGLAIALRMPLMDSLPVGDVLLRWSYDYFFRFQIQPKPPEVAIVFMDEDSASKLGQSWQADRPWDRALHAQLVRRLKAAGARLVVFDLVPDEATQSAADQAWAAAMKETGPVILGAVYEWTQLARGAEQEHLVFPLSLLREAAAGVGLAETLKDSDYTVRELLEGTLPGMVDLPSLPVIAAEIYLGNSPLATNRLVRPQGSRWINYYGPPNHLFNLSYFAALWPTNSPDYFFSNKVVFVGTKPMAGYPGAGRDEFRSPHTWWQSTFMSGVEIHATAFANIVRGEWLHTAPWWVESLVLLVLGASFGAGLSVLRPLPAGMVALAGMIAITALAWVAFVWFRFWGGWLYIAVLQIPLAFAWSTIVNSHRFYAEKKVLEHSLALHLSPDRVRQIQSRPELLRPGAEEHEISILFSDISNFSVITSRMQGQDLFAMLNRYFEVALECVYETDGTVIKLAGDSIFAIWNAPFAQKEHVRSALRAAILLRDRLDHFDHCEKNLPLRTRIGLHMGLANVGNVGSSRRFDYTAIGESVNLASRLEGLNKYLGTQILVTREMLRFEEQRICARCLGHFRVKGFDRLVEVHEPLDWIEAGKPPPPWLASFKDGLFHFQRQAFGPASAAFEEVLKSKTDDGPATFYLQQIKSFQAHPPGPDWVGDIILHEK